MSKRLIFVLIHSFGFNYILLDNQPKYSIDENIDYAKVSCITMCLMVGLAKLVKDCFIVRIGNINLLKCGGIRAVLSACIIVLYAESGNLVFVMF